jgi:hypothetical protein
MLRGSTYNAIWDASEREIRDLLELERTKDPALMPAKV